MHDNADLQDAASLAFKPSLVTVTPITYNSPRLADRRICAWLTEEVDAADLKDASRLSKALSH